jgi:HEPN domain-containing protein
VHRNDFKTVARLRVAEARCLLDAGHYAGAYYLCGYAVECALKAVIAKQFRQHSWPDRNLVRDIYTHDTSKLLGLAGLTQDQKQKASADQRFAINWVLVTDWSEQSRYIAAGSARDAADLYKAICERNHGVLPWLRNWW